MHSVGSTEVRGRKGRRSGGLPGASPQLCTGLGPAWTAGEAGRARAPGQEQGIPVSGEGASRGGPPVPVSPSPNLPPQSSCPRVGPGCTPHTLVGDNALSRDALRGGGPTSPNVISGIICDPLHDYFLRLLIDRREAPAPPTVYANRQASLPCTQ